MKNIIFLDIDGVLNDNQVDIVLESVITLKRLVEVNNADIVMITSKIGNGVLNRKKKVANLMKRIGFNSVDFIESNLISSNSNISVSYRVLGIIDYLKKIECNYVILDDEFTKEYQLFNLNHYETPIWIGLRNNDLEHIKFKKNNPNNWQYIKYQYRELGEYEKVTTDLIKVLKQVSIKK